MISRVVPEHLTGEAHALCDVQERDAGSFLAPTSVSYTCHTSKQQEPSSNMLSRAVDGPCKC